MRCLDSRRSATLCVKEIGEAVCIDEITRPEQSFCIAGPSAKGIGNDECYDIRSSYGVQVVQESCKPSTPASRLTHKTQLAMVAADSAGCHRDAILALASVNLSSQRLISANRDGAVKVRK
ncbi:putative serine/threonine-protein kinase vps15 [Hordeum vulgare]|nr:putative serine/threonine-protein kinase vps15 [Hordeum vulgare]